MTDECGICHAAWNGREEMIPCSGVCNMSFHLECSGINKTVYNNLMKSPQLRYYCKPCSQINTIAVVQRIDVLAESMKALCAQFTELAALMTTAMSANALVAQTTAPTFRSNDHLKTVDIIGTDLSTSVLKSVPVAQDKFIYVGGLDPVTTKEEVIDYVMGKLNTSSPADVSCRTLVPIDKDITRLTFISFKVGVPGARFEELMKPEMWPKGVKVHEFVQKPPRQRNLPTVRPPRLQQQQHSKND